MKVVVKSPLNDLFSFILHLKRRKKIFRKGSKKRIPEGQMNILARQLHPKQQILIIDNIRFENETTISCRLVSKDNCKVAFFRAGQYLSIDLNVNGTRISRPFSISSTPEDAIENNFYEITIKTKSNGFFTSYIRDNWKAGTTVYASEPMGFFYYEPLRDSKEIICLAGGTGITPFRSIIKDTLGNYSDVTISLFYGIDTPSDLILEDFFKGLEADYLERFKLVTVCTNHQEKWQGESGFITAELIEKHIDSVSSKSFFVCGSGEFHRFINNELAGFSLPGKFIRRENYNVGTEENRGDNPVQLNVTIGSRQITINANPRETILTSLERAGLYPPANCRSGECGWCRSRLVSGEIDVSEANDGRRMADIKFGYFHPCSSYALTNLEIVCPENPRIIVKEKLK